MKTLTAQSTVLVVGASGGIGAALTQQLLNDSAVGCVWAACREPQTNTIQALQTQFGERIRPIGVDVTEAESVRAMAEHIQAHTPQLHLLINAFGFLHDESRNIWPEKRIEDISPEGMEANFRVNTLAPALIARYCFALLNHRERAVLANLSARVGSIGDNRLGGWYAYRASKAAQNMLTRGLAVESQRRAKQLICLALHPGTTDTALSAPFQRRVPEGKLFSAQFAASQLLMRIDQASTADSGGFFAWDGEPIPF